MAQFQRAFDAEMRRRAELSDGVLATLPCIMRWEPPQIWMPSMVQYVPHGMDVDCMACTTLGFCKACTARGRTPLRTGPW